MSILWRQAVVVLAVGAGLVNADGIRGRDRLAGPYRPPVLREGEPADSGVVALPGAVKSEAAPVQPLPNALPRARKAASPKPPSAAATRTPAAAQTAAAGTPSPLQTTAAAQPPVPAQTTAAAIQPAAPVQTLAPKPYLPADFERESALYCQKRIGEWTQPDAYNVLGQAVRQRPAYDEKRAPNGRIYAFRDPSGRYRELELDFAAGSGLLRTVFVYPWKMTWEDCRHLWGSNVAAADARRGRRFYSYLNRRLDVLVEPGGAVVSLGLY